MLGRIAPRAARTRCTQSSGRSTLPVSHEQPLDAPGRPAAHADYLQSHDGLVGHIADEDWRWRRRHNYYLNCLRDADTPHHDAAR